LAAQPDEVLLFCLWVLAPGCFLRRLTGKVSPFPGELLSLCTRKEKVTKEKARPDIRV